MYIANYLFIVDYGCGINVFSLEQLCFPPLTGNILL